MPNAIEVTASDIRKFKECRRAWDFYSSLRQNLEPNRENTNLLFGSIMHEMLTGWYIGDIANPAKQFVVAYAEARSQIDETTLHPDIREQYDRLGKLGPKLLRSYVRWAKLNDNFDVVEVEQRHSVRLNDVVPGMFFSFKYDMLVQREGQYWLLDFKTSGRLPTDTGWLQIDDQSIGYQWATEQALGIPIAGMIYQFIYKKMPTKPKVLKSGELSKAKMVTTYIEYVEELRRLGIDPAKYAAKLAEIDEAEGERYFKRVAVTSTRQQRERKANEIRQIAEIMAQPDLLVYPSPGQRTCASCDFRNPCFMMDSADIQPMLKSFYRQREPRE